MEMLVQGATNATIMAYLAKPIIGPLSTEFVVYTNASNTTIDIAQTITKITNLRSNNDFMLEKVLDETVKLINLMPNLLKIYVCMDGVPNVAKMKEQLHRRVGGAVEKGINDNLKGLYLSDPISTGFSAARYEFSRSNISPNSAFMGSLIDKLSAELIARLAQANPKPQLTIDGTTVDGEAEHKIMNYVKNGPVENAMFYSPDSDTIILAAIMNIIMGKPTNILKFIPQLTRKDNWVYKYNVIDINKFIDYLKTLLDTESDAPHISNRKIIDMLFIFNVLGDDFIPKLTSINIMNDFNTIFDIYNISYLNSDKLLTQLKGITEAGADSDSESESGSGAKLKGLVMSKSGSGSGSGSVPSDPFILKETSGIWSINSNNLLRYLYLLSVDENDRFVENTEDIKKFPNIGRGLINGLHRFELEPPRRTYLFLTELLKNGFHVTKRYLQYNKQGQPLPGQTPIARDPFVVKLDETTGNLIGFDKNKNHGYFNNIFNFRLEHHSNPDMVKNYLQGYQYVLDVYFNNMYMTTNRCWYYRFEAPPSLADIVGHLSPLADPSTAMNEYFASYNTPLNNPLINPSNPGLRFFTRELHAKFLNDQILAFKALNDITEQKPITYKRARKMYKCLNNMYTNKCGFVNQPEFSAPGAFLLANPIVVPSSSPSTGSASGALSSSGSVPNISGTHSPRENAQSKAGSTEQSGSTPSKYYTSNTLYNTYGMNSLLSYIIPN